MSTRFATSPLVTALAVGALLLTTSCRRDEIFPDIGDRVVSPVDVAVSDQGSHFYVLNADFDRTYNEGTVLVLDESGNKVRTVTVPRMGRTITVAGNDMIVTIDRSDEDHDPQAMLFDVTDPAAPALVKTFDLECSPYNVAMRKGYQYFALACFDGQLYMGTLAANRPDSTLKHVRSYGITRRALFLDPARGLLLGFSTDPSKQTWSDWNTIDQYTYTDSKDGPVRKVEGRNEIPDDREDSKTAQSSKGSRQIHQFFVYDIVAESQAQSGCTPTAEDDCTFPYREVTEELGNREVRWLYFSLNNFDGTPDGQEGFNDANYKYYRTNFWEAKPDPTDPNAFYISHRGPPKETGSPFANQIVRVSIVGDLRATDDGPPKTGDVLTFERVYGFKGVEATKYHYPGDFEVTEVGGQKLLLVNHFRDLINWVRGDVYFSIAAKVLDDGGSWTVETTENTDPELSWYQIAVNQNGRAVSCSFYGNKVVMLDVIPGMSMTEVKRIE